MNFKKLMMVSGMMLVSSSSFALETTSSYGPADDILESAKKTGVILTALGTNCGGVPGYLAESKDGKTQIFYMTPDRKFMIAGVCLNSNGTIITGYQIADMNARVEAEKVGTLPAKPDVAQPLAQKNDVPVSAISNQVDSVKVQPNIETSDNIYVNKVFPHDVFEKGLEDGYQFSLGDVNKLPVVYMVADPNCPACHEAWKVLNVLVQQQKIAIKFILVNGLGKSTDDVISILARDSGLVWQKGEGSVEGVKIAPPPATNTKEYQDAYALFNAGEKFKRDFALKATPLLAYKGTDKKIYMHYGVPKNFQDFLKELKK